MAEATVAIYSKGLADMEQTYSVAAPITSRGHASKLSVNTTIHMLNGICALLL